MCIYLRENSSGMPSIISAGVTQQKHWAHDHFWLVGSFGQRCCHFRLTESPDIQDITPPTCSPAHLFRWNFIFREWTWRAGADDGSLFLHCPSSIRHLYLLHSSPIQQTCLTGRKLDFIARKKQIFNSLYHSTVRTSIRTQSFISNLWKEKGL